MGKHAGRVSWIEPVHAASIDIHCFRKLPWYSAEITEITPQAQELFEKYSNVEPGNIKAHVKELVCDRSWLLYLIVDH